MKQENDNYWYGELVKHFECKEWSEVQITNLAMKIGRSSVMNCEIAVELLEYVQNVDQEIAKQKEIDAIYATAPVFNREQIIRLKEIKRADAGWE
jgi:hypothetical protein